MSVDTSAGPVLEVLASVLGLSPEQIAGRASAESFLGLGGDSVSAMDVVAKAEEELGLVIDLGLLIGLAPLNKVLVAAVPGAPGGFVPGSEPSLELSRPVLPEQDGYLSAERFVGGTAMHEIISGELVGPLDERALAASVERLVTRHEGLRTVFEESPDGYRRRILRTWRPGLVRQSVHLPPGADPAETVHGGVVKGSRHLISSFGRPAHAFVLTRFTDRHHMLTLVIHHALADGWAAGLIWKELAVCYAAERAGTAVELPTAPTPDLLADRRERLGQQEKGQNRLAELAGYPTVVEVPSDVTRPARFDFEGARIHVGLGPEARDAVNALAAGARVTHNSVLLAAWQLVIARRAATRRFLMGISVTARTDAASRRLVAPCAALVPIRCDVRDELSVEQYLRRTSAAVGEGVSASSVPIGVLSRGLRALTDGRRTPLIQVAFSAQDFVLPDELEAADLKIRMHEAFKGHTAADVSLFVLRWGERPRLAVEYATSVLAAHEAAALAEALEATVLELAEHSSGSLERVRAMSARQRELLDGWRRPAPCPVPAQPAEESGIWDNLERCALEHWDQPAVHDPGRDLTLTYGQLLRAATGQAASLAARGVGENDLVAIALPRSVNEVVAVLATLRLGAAYLPLDLQSPAERLGRILATARPAAVVGTERTLASLRPVLPPGCVAQLPGDSGSESLAEATSALMCAAPDDPDRVAYVIFTSGSSGEPKGVRVRHRGVTRLVLQGGIAAFRPGDHMLRLAALGFDISALELFGPLLNGGTIDIFPAGLPHPSAMAAFFRTYGISVCVLPSAVFRTLAEHRPDAFAAVRRVLVGGDVVPPESVRALLKRHPALTVSNSYGPTENTVVTSQHDMTEAAEVDVPLPIGRPVAGTGVVVLDDGGGLVPPGGVGELCCLGDGLAVDYLLDRARTEQAFGMFEGERYYRSGDLGRWDGGGRLRFLGRTDRQVKIRGYRVEPDEVLARISEHPAVADVVVTAVGDDAESRRLLVAVVLREPLADPLDQLKRFAGEGLPRAMTPDLWVIVDEIPLTPNGKHDVRRLEALAVHVDPHL